MIFELSDRLYERWSLFFNFNNYGEYFMLKLSETGIGLLTRQYRSVLKKCFLINVGLFALGVAMAPEAKAATGCSNLTSSSSLTDVINCLKGDRIALGAMSTASDSWTTALGSLNTASQGGAAIGSRNTASGDNSSAFGYYNTASGD
ncbi:MAG: hypothetical protein IJS88_02430, partial [Alphaproteobacteria bacterium]|nr:hypothetical protein [Alphaproteobacteria bacterium]